MAEHDETPWFDDYAEDVDDIQIEEYDITAAPNDFNILTGLLAYSERNVGCWRDHATREPEMAQDGFDPIASRSAADGCPRQSITFGTRPR